MIRMFIAAVIVAGASGGASAQDAKAFEKKLEKKLNEVGICQELPELNIIKVAEVIGFGISIPDWLPIDLGARWDKNFHNVYEFIREDGKVRAEIQVDCRPSKESAPIKAGLTTQGKMALADRVTCEGQLTNGSVSGMNCKVRGKIGQLFAKYINLNAKVSGAVEKTL